jgi:hypothetical protein
VQKYIPIIEILPRIRPWRGEEITLHLGQVDVKPDPKPKEIYKSGIHAMKITKPGEQDFIIIEIITPGDYIINEALHYTIKIIKPGEYDINGIRATSANFKKIWKAENAKFHPKYVRLMLPSNTEYHIHNDYIFINDIVNNQQLSSWQCFWTSLSLMGEIVQMEQKKERR